jgi:two-component system nitrate/nitrite response regulator NarL
MAGDGPVLDAAALRQVRRVVSAIHGASAGGVPRAELLRLAARLGESAGPTIDFEAARELGQPLVVLRPVAPPRPAACLAGLSPRELEVARLIAHGLSNKDIAVRLCISLPTVKDHVHRILAKSGLPSRLAVMAAFILGDQPSRS